MPITPKHKKSVSSRKFTDRIPYLASFEKAVNNIQKDNFNVFVFYGVGGIGKTRLRKECCKKLIDEFTDSRQEVIDFDIPAFRQCENALFKLSSDLKSAYKLKTPSFDIAYAIYWKKTHPNTSLESSELPLLDQSELVATLVDTVGNIPIVGIVSNVAMIALRSHGMIKEWWVKRGKNVLKEIEEYEPKDILERLPSFLADDILYQLENTSQKLVLFLDTYEALWEGDHNENWFFNRDEWIRDFIASMPGVLFVIMGREKLRWSELDKDWNEILSQHHLADFEKNDSDSFLTSCGITEDEIRQTIIESGRGVPYYLDLSADTYLAIKENGKRPQVSDFSKNKREIFERFLRYLDRYETMALKVLSAPRTWNNEIFALLMEKFNTGYPSRDMSGLVRFSFVIENEPGIFTLHDLMRESLQNNNDESFNKEIHKFLFEYYNSKANVEISRLSEEEEEAQIEALYHAKEIYTPCEVFEWLYTTTDKFYTALNYNFLFNLWQNFLEWIIEASGESYELGATYTALSILFTRYGNMIEGEKYLDIGGQMLDKVLKDAEENDKRRLFIGECFALAAAKSYIKGNAEDSINLFKKALEIKEKILEPGHIDIVITLKNIGIIYLQKNDFQEGIALLEKAKGLAEKNEKERITLAEILMELSIGCADTGDFGKSEELLNQAEKIFSEQLGEENPQYFNCRIAKASIFSRKKMYTEAYGILYSTLSKINEFKLNIPTIVNSLYSRLGKVCMNLNEFQKAASYYEEAIERRTKTYGKDRNEMVLLYKGLLEAYEKGGLSEKSLEIKQKMNELETSDV